MNIYNRTIEYESTEESDNFICIKPTVYLPLCDKHGILSLFEAMLAEGYQFLTILQDGCYIYKKIDIGRCMDDGTLYKPSISESDTPD